MRPFRLESLLLLVAMTLTLGSCAKLPTAPDTTKPGATTSVLYTDDPPAPFTGRGGIVSWIDLSANQAGTLDAGWFRLVIPKNALRSDARIAMLQVNPAEMKVEFEVFPASANNFKVPVKLIADCSRDPLADVRRETIYWWNRGWDRATGVAISPGRRLLSTHTHQLTDAKVDLDTHAAKDNGKK